MQRTQLFADPADIFLHDLVLNGCRQYGERICIVDTSLTPYRRISYADYGAMVESVARGLVAAGIQPGEIVGVYLPNSWEFGVAYHAIQLAGAIPTLFNPSYREREVRYQLEASTAVALITDGAQIGPADGFSHAMDLSGLGNLRKVWTTRHHGGNSEAFATLLRSVEATLPAPTLCSYEMIATLPFSSGTTGLPKGVMLSHHNLVANVYQILGENGTPVRDGDHMLGFLPLYHIYGMTVLLNLAFAKGVTLVLMPRFVPDKVAQLITEEGIHVAAFVPPALNAMVHLAEEGKFPKDHAMRWVKSGAAPLPPELARRFPEHTGIPILQGYGMTEASPVTHIGFIEEAWYRPHMIGHPVALTDCRLVDEEGNDVRDGQPGELIMRGPQFMLGYWNAPEATASVMKDGWYYSGDVAVRDEHGFYAIVDRRKEMIKFKGFAMAPAEIEGVLMEHAAVRDCGVVGKPDDDAGELPCAFVVLRAGFAEDAHTAELLRGHVSERLVNYKAPREVRFVEAIPRNPSGKILRRELRDRLK